jgi:predicted RNA-binding Zn ribbon-like protein
MDSLMVAQFPMLSGGTVLDFLNTSASEDTPASELLSSDQSVVEWMRAKHLLDAATLPRFESGRLVCAARALRETIRRAVLQRKSGGDVDIESLNAFLNRGSYRVSLLRESNGHLHLAYEYERATPEQLLAPIANAAAELLAVGNFNLIRKCECEARSLWCYEKAKSRAPRNPFEENSQ